MHNTLTKTITRLCKSAGIEGFKTNHSLRATAATRLYESGVDEQMVMEVTGHRSLEGVRNYKRTTSQQKEVLSDILNSTKNVATSASAPQMQNQLQISAKSLSPPKNQLQISATQNQQIQTSGSTPEQQDLCIHPVSTTANIQTNTKNSLPGHVFNFNSCSSVTFNIQYN